MFYSFKMLGTLICYLIKAIVLGGAYILNYILDIFTSGIDQNISIALITIQAGLMLVSLTFLPMLIDGRNKEYYLGYKITDWIIYKKGNKKLNDIKMNWIINVILIVLEIILLQLEYYSFVFLLFLVFIYLISKKVINYTDYITNPNIYDTKIETHFLENAKKDKEEIIKQIEKTCLNDIKSFTKTISFMLKNLDKECIKDIFSSIYSFINESSNQNYIYTMYELISNNIEECKINKPLNFVVRDYEWYKFIKTSVNEANEYKIFSIFLTIYENNLKQYDLNKYNYTQFLKNTQTAIEDSNLSNATKKKWFDSIINNINMKVRTKGLKLNERQMFRYRDTVEFIKYIIDSKDEYKLNAFYEMINNKGIFKDEILPIIIGVYVYLIYLTEYEEESYINNEEKEYYKAVLNKITEYMDLTDKVIYKTLSTNEIINIFDALSYSYMNWERMKLWVVKNVNVETAYSILYKIFVIYSKKKFFEMSDKIWEKELDIFKYTMPAGKFDESLAKSMLDISKKLKINLTEEDLNQYAKNVTNYITKRYKDDSLISKEDYMEQLNKAKELEKSSNIILSKSDIFKNTDFKVKHKIKCKYNYIISNNVLEAYIKSLLEEPNELKLMIESRIYNMLASKLHSRGEYNYKGEKLLEKLNDYKDNNYIYLTYEEDDYGEDYMLGKPYNDVLEKYKVINTSISAAKIIINKLEVKFNKININLLELTDAEIENEMIRYKVSDDKYIYNNTEYGFSIDLNENEMKEFIKKNFTNFEVNFSISYGDEADLDGCVLLYNFND